MIRALTLLLVLGLASLTFANQTVEPSHIPSADALLSEINQARAKENLAQLRTDADLNRLSKEWADYLMESGKLEHRSSLLRVAVKNGLNLITENIWRGSEPMSASHIVYAWLKSPGHAQNLLSRDSTLGGAAIVVSASGQTIAVFQGGRR